MGCPLDRGGLVHDWGGRPLDACPGAPPVRLFEYGIGYEDGVHTDWHLHVTPHHDIKLVSPIVPYNSCHTIPEDGFTSPRNDVVNAFTSGYPFGDGHQLLKWSFWNNDKLIGKCGGRVAGSDGWVAFVAASSFDPPDTTN